MRPIDAEDFYKKIFIMGIQTDGISVDIPTACEMIREQLVKQPTLDVVPVVHAHWIQPIRGNAGPCCSACKRLAKRLESGAYFEPDYCPHCGAKMDEERSSQK